MDKQDILDYVKHTPYNTNIAVLSTMLDSYKESIIASLEDNKEESQKNVTKIESDLF